MTHNQDTLGSGRKINLHVTMTHNQDTLGSGRKINLHVTMNTSTQPDLQQLINQV